MDISKLRGEQEILEELQVVCATLGFAHIIACFCARDNFIWYRHEMTAEDMQHLYSRSRLIRTEIFTLIGLMVQADPDYDVPPPPDATALFEQVEALLEELHQTMTVPWIAAFNNAAQIGGQVNPLTSGDALREPIFYGGEAAFAFQNCEFAALKYAGDNDWLIANRGASIKQMIAVTKAIAKIQNKKVLKVIKAEKASPESGSLLPAFQFTVHEVAKIADLPEVTVAACIDAFAFNQSSGNGKFKALNDYNAVNGSPIIPLPRDRFLLFHFYALAEALYDSPFYWLGADKSYASTAFSNRGNFTEQFAFDRLVDVFGTLHVHRGVNIERVKGKRVAEIDGLVLFGDRAIVLQAKSKRLTLEARRGNDLQIKDDFKAAVQDAYDQAMSCAEALFDPTIRLFKSDGSDLQLSTPITQIFPLCLVADHYPALNFQTEQFLKTRHVDHVLAPLVIDVFTLDAMAEMLNRPLRFISYLELRALFGKKVHISHEITLLSYHLKYNLWLSGEYDFVALEDDFAADLEIAMAARRLGLSGKATPAGILTAIDGRLLDRIIAEIEAEPFGAMIDLVLLLYQLGGGAMSELADGVETVVAKAAKKGSSDFSIGFGGTGLTVHSNFAPRLEAEQRLEAHCLMRKYRQKADSWFGLWLSPGDGHIQMGKKVAYPWTHDRAMAVASKHLGKAANPETVERRSPKIGRTDPCHCGSGKKYKKCHFMSDERTRRSR